jgi:hypothetical protein
MNNLFSTLKMDMTMDLKGSKHNRIAKEGSSFNFNTIR